ncbi:hypothetical protein Tco_1148431, partial [Tanacetum coccineum]
MEASRRSQIALAASASQPEHAHHKEVIKPALDFNFQDIEGLLQIIIDFDQISEDGDKLADGIKFLSLEVIDNPVYNGVMSGGGNALMMIKHWQGFVILAFLPEYREACHNETLEQ